MEIYGGAEVQRWRRCWVGAEAQGSAEVIVILTTITILINLPALLG